MKSKRPTIMSLSKGREIGVLLHFTQAANLPGIVRHGLLPRRELERSNVTAFASDQYRLDANDDAISISISRINEAMFASKRKKSGHDDWVTIVLSPEILWTHNCRFCWCNAARNEIKNHRGRRDGPWAFAKMFAESGDMRFGLNTSHPTDPEAEVQVMQPISPTYILGAVVYRPEMVEPVQEVLSELFEATPLVVVDEF